MLRRVSWIATAGLVLAITSIGCGGGGGGDGDTTRPTISDVRPADAAVVDGCQVTVSGDAADESGIARVRIRVNGGSWRTANGTTEWSLEITLTDGENTVEIEATDASSNSNVRTMTLTVTTDCESGAAGAGTLFIGMGEFPGVAIVEGASAADGHTTLDRYIAGNQTRLADPNYYSCFVDAATDDLYVGDEGAAAVHVFSPAGTVDGNRVPARSIRGSSVPFIEPGGIAVDSRRDILYVADIVARRVFAWDDASTAGGNIAPDRTIDLGHTVNDIFVDEANDRAYLCGGASISVLEDVSGLDGLVESDRRVTGGATGLQGGAMAVDIARDRLYVTVRDQERILVFNNLGAMDGNVAPLHTIAGDRTGLDAPMDLCLDPDRGHLYQINDSGRDQTVRVWHNAPAANGNVAPDRAIHNAAGLLQCVVSVFFAND